MRTFLRLMGVWIALLFLGSPGGAQQTVATDVSIGLSSKSFGTAAARLADEMGFFREHGIKARFVTLDSGSTAASALISGSVQLVLSGPGELLAAQARGIQIVGVAKTAAGLSGSLILSKAVATKVDVDRGASVADRLKALNGLLIAAPSPTSSYTAPYKGAAEALGAKPRFTYMAQTAMPAALESGSIQGYVAGAPIWGAQVSAGTALLLISGPKAELPAQYIPASSGSLQATRAFAESHPDLIQRIRAALFDVAAAVGSRPQSVKEALGRLYPELAPASLDLLFSTESSAWTSERMTEADIARDLDVMRFSGAPRLENVDPASAYLP